MSTATAMTDSIVVNGNKIIRARVSGGKAYTMDLLWVGAVIEHDGAKYKVIDVLFNRQGVYVSELRSEA